MLRLKGITKNYTVAGGEIEVLKGLDVCFRKNEFVSILGPSGCGKTTTLNIIGGLDKYTSGDLIISGKSTKDFKDRDWDTYRNQRIGFVFQTYNLIPHQTVLGNVELALTISGISKEERIRRSFSALEKVGLKGEEFKRPNQLSGGQCQRVAIARALVNEPDILLADEPTGALDSKTSVQIMDLIKEISKDKLVIMVTHNKEIAEQYSSRIIKLVDGEIVEDSNPFSEQDEIAEMQELDKNANSDNKKTKKKRAKMNFWTAFKLSLRNLLTKRGRTVLTSFAGSIGIIGISLILAVSQGTTAYINHVQETTLSSYPLTIEEQNVDLTSLMQSFMNIDNSELKHDKDNIHKDQIISELVKALSQVETNENDLKSFKTFLEKEIKNEDSPLSGAITGISYSYDLDFQIYTQNVDGEIIKSDTQELMFEMLGKFMVGKGAGGNTSSGMQGQDDQSFMFSSMLNNSGMWQELLPSKDGAVVNDLIKNQYELIHGDWPSAYNEIVVIVNERNELDDLTLYALGLISEQEIDAIIDAAVEGVPLEQTGKSVWTYEEVCGKKFRTVMPYNCYIKQNDGTFADMSTTDKDLLYRAGMDLTIKGIIREKDDVENHMLSGGAIGYTYKLTEHIINNAKDAEVVKAQLNSPDVDVVSGLPFKATTGKLTVEEKETAFKNYVSALSDKGKKDAYIKIKSIIPADVLQGQLLMAMQSYQTRDAQEQLILQALSSQMDLSSEQLKPYIEEMSDDDVKNYTVMILTSKFQQDYADRQYQIYAQQDEQQLAQALESEVANYTKEQCATYYDLVTEFSSSTYEDNLEKFGYLDLSSPAEINIYASSFANKDAIVQAINDYNEGKETTSQIKYTDYVGILMASITTIVDAITYVLIAFVAISLIVSSIMIAVITLISVQERTKEIGILRSLGASKGDVSRMFNAETVIIGLTAGLTGVLITYLLCIPINLILYALTSLASLKAVLPIGAAAILVGISVVLTLISGLIPSRSAAKKDPVVALRTE